MIEAARSELALIPQADWARQDVIEARIALHMAAKEWELMAGFGQQLARRYPDVAQGWIHWAYALRELQLIKKARDVLTEAEPLHGQASSILHYNLACYLCLLGDTGAARERLRTVNRMDATLGTAAQDDPDLAALWT